MDNETYSSRKGGLMRVRLHGNPGTTAGRRLGGLRSLKTHGIRRTRFKTLVHVNMPRPSRKLAELFGILAGDGHVGEYQVSITTNSKTDIAHARHAKRLLEDIFKLPVSFRYKTNQNACVVYVSSKAVSRFLVSKGLVFGNKVTVQLRMPDWISKNQGYRISFVRGLFDTDGCAYIDRHRINSRLYENPCMAFTNRSLPLLAAFKSVLLEIGLHPTQKTKYEVFLRRRDDIVTYFDIVGSSNPKHLKRIRRCRKKKWRGVRVV